MGLRGARVPLCSSWGPPATLTPELASAGTLLWTHTQAEPSLAFAAGTECRHQGPRWIGMATSTVPGRVGVVQDLCPGCLLESHGNLLQPPGPRPPRASDSVCVGPAYVMFSKLPR